MDPKDERFTVEIETGGRVTITRAGAPFCEHVPGKFTLHGLDRAQLLALEQANSAAVMSLQGALMAMAQEAAK